MHKYTIYYDSKFNGRWEMLERTVYAPNDKAVEDYIKNNMTEFVHCYIREK